ncbi:hypothetical protein AALP_AA5G152200 [Arabis alpina]|uniref:MATH domain-containing protein n=1 Tax=Arabis alpina TaxID=50452 RepID=A0A087GX87_ARAAL|nr:hypothetical protein AALP_AA5G152200 [Arabis alpina]
MLQIQHCFDEQSPTLGYTFPYQVLAEDGGFLVNGELMIVAEVIGASDVFEESIPFEKVRGQRVSCSSFTGRICESLIETLYQPLEELSNEDLVEADIALTYLKDVGFKVDWLEKKLDPLKEKKEKERSCEARVHEMEAQLHDLKHKFEAEKAELSATRAPLSFHDFV